MLVAIGSKAALFYLDLHRKPTDLDLVGSLDEAQAWFTKNWGKAKVSCPIAEGKKWLLRTGKLICEVELTWPGSSAQELHDLAIQEGFTANEIFIPSLDFLYMLKLTHRYRKNSPHFLKTMRDIWLMRAEGAKLRPEHQDFFKRREAWTYSYQHPKLNQSKKEFFNGDGVQYVYDHDDIHRVVALPGTPAYKLFAKDGEEVASDKGKFALLPREDQLRAVREESCVLAIERSLVPHPGVLSPRRAFEVALMKVCTSITSGWFREFAWENYDAVLKTYDENYWKKFAAMATAGGVLKHR